MNKVVKLNPKQLRNLILSEMKASGKNTLSETFFTTSELMGNSEEDKKAYCEDLRIAVSQVVVDALCDYVWGDLRHDIAEKLEAKLQSLGIDSTLEVPGRIEDVEVLVQPAINDILSKSGIFASELSSVIAGLFEKIIINEPIDK
jgi:hypothetical protein